MRVTLLFAIIGFSEVLTERMFGELNEKQAECLKDCWPTPVSLRGAAIRGFRVGRSRKEVALVADPELSTDDLPVSRFLTGLPWAP